MDLCSWKEILDAIKVSELTLAHMDVLWWNEKRVRQNDVEFDEGCGVMVEARARILLACKHVSIVYFVSFIYF
jgi:hypothetical protein